MMKQDEETFGSREERVAKVLENVGFKKPHARVITYFLCKERGASREIEILTGLRQPEVSVATCYFREIGYLRCENIFKEGKGRPKIVYIRLKTVNKIIKDIVDKIERETKLIVDTISELKSMDLGNKKVSNEESENEKEERK